jgi:hypothetical protein
MKNVVALACLVSVGFLLTARTGFGQIITNTVNPQILSATGTLTVVPGDTLNVSGASGKGKAAITFNGSSGNTLTVINNGTIEQSGTVAGNNNDNALTDTNGHTTVIIDNNAGALIETADDDVIHLSKATNNVTLNNYGTITSENASNGSNQGVNLGGITTGSNTINNYAGGVIQASDSDAVRPGVNGVVNNFGTIKSVDNASATGGDDGIDAQTNTGAIITNGGSGSTGLNLIEGARHGITGGNTGTNTSTPIYTDTLNPTDPGVFTMSVTNNAGSTIQGDNGSGINIDGFGGFIDPSNPTASVTYELVTINNTGTITGDGLTRDGDGVDVDGAVILNNNGSIISKNAFTDSGIEFSEGVTVGGGTIVNGVNGVIEGEVAPGNTSAVGRGITLAGVDKGADDSQIPLQSVYAYFDPTTGTLVDPSITNSGLIKGDSESGIAVLGTTGGGLTVTITNNATGTIEGNNTGISENSLITSGSYTGQSTGQSLNQGAIELDDTSNTYVVTDYGTIKQDNLNGGTAVEMHGVSNTLNIFGGSASIIGNISGNTAANSVLTINPGNGNSFSYGYEISNFTVNINSDGSTGTVTLSGANNYTGPTTLSGGTTYVNNTSGSGTGIGSMLVKNTATLGGTGTILPSGTNAITVAAGGAIAAGGVQPASVSTGNSNVANGNLTLDTSSFTRGTGINPNAILNLNSAKLTFALGSGNADSGSKIVVTGGVANTIAFSGTTTVTINDLVDTHLTLNQEYVLVEGDNTTYTGLDFGATTALGEQITGGLQLLASGTNGNFFSQWYNSSDLYLQGDNIVVEVVPEPQTWAMMLGGLAFLLFCQFRRHKRN